MSVAQFFCLLLVTSALAALGFEHMFALSNYVWTSNTITPDDVPYYRHLPSSMKNSTAKFFLDYFVLQSDYLRVIHPVGNMFYYMRRFSETAPYFHLLFIGCAIAFEVAKGGILLSFFLFNCPSTWYCFTPGPEYPVSYSPSFEFFVIVASSGVFLGLSLLSILYNRAVVASVMQEVRIRKTAVARGHDVYA